MSTTAISFPGLGFTIDPSGVVFSVFGHDIRWYGVIIAIGFSLAVVYALKRCDEFGIVQDDLLDALLVAAPTAIIGARLYYVIFNYDIFRGDPGRIIQIWTGGLAIYGGLIGGLAAGAIVAKIKKMKVFALLDLTSLGFLIGQSIGRWGNFINREAYGTITTLPWRMEIYDYSYGGRVAVHPAFLYESLWNALGFLLLHFISKKKKYDGQIILLYLAWYGFGRGIIEGFRTDSLYFLDTNLRVSQVLGFASCIVALLIIGYIALFKKRDDVPA